MKERYCSACGSVLVKTRVPAEKFKYEMPDNGKIRPRTHTKHNPETGNRQYVFRYTCPNLVESWRTKLFGSKHDKYLNGELFEDDGGKLKKIK